MSGNKRTLEQQKSGHLSKKENNPFERIPCIPAPHLLARTKIAQLLIKSRGCSASSPTAWILLRIIVKVNTIYLYNLYVPVISFSLKCPL